MGIRKECKESNRRDVCHYPVWETAVCYRRTANGIVCCHMCEESFPFMCHHLYLPVTVVSCPHGFIYYLRKYHSDLNDITFLFFLSSSRQIVIVPRNKIHECYCLFFLPIHTFFLNYCYKIMSASIVTVKLVLRKPLQVLVAV